MGGKALQPSFSRGELSPSLYGRVDLELYRAALKTCRNFIPRAYGGIENRPGTQFIAETKSSAASRLIPFQFSSTQNYVLEFGNQYIRFYRDGARLTSGGSPLEISTPYTTAQLADLRYVQSADVMTIVHSSHPPRELRRLSDTSWELVLYENENGPFKEINTNESIAVWTNKATGNVTINSSESIFNAGHVGSLFYMEARNLADVDPWEPNKQIAYDGASPLGELRRNSEGNVYRCVTSQSASAGEEIRTGNIEPTHLKGRATCGDGNEIRQGSTLFAERAGVEWEYLHSYFGVVQITARTSGTQVTGTVVKRLPDAVVSSASIATRGTFAGTGSQTTFSLSGATSDDSADYQVTVVTTYIEPDGPSWTITTTMASSEYSVSSAANEITFNSAPGSNQDITVKEFIGANNTDIWAFSAWSNEEGYPSAVTYYSDRLVFSGTPEQPQTVWMTGTGVYKDFQVSTPTVDSDAITFTINARQVNAIRELLPLSDLVLLTVGGEWRMVADGVVAPATISLKPQSYRGSRNVRAELVGNRALYVQSQGSAIRELAYSLESDGYVGGDLTISADHLLDGRTIKEIDFHQSPYSAVWAVRDDGALLSMTYVPEEQVIGWARHDTDGEFESVCVIPEGDEDAVYFIVKRTINGSTKRYVERMKPRYFESAEDAFFVDCGLTYSGSATSSVSGLDHLEGKTVSILNDGNVEAQKVVSGGSIDLDNPGSTVHVGLPIEADAQTLDVSVWGGESVRDRQKLVTQVSLLVKESRGIFAGTKEVSKGEGITDSLLEFRQRDLEHYDDPVSPLTGIATVQVTSTYNDKGSVFIRQADPLPLTILSIIPEIDVAR